MRTAQCKCYLAYKDPQPNKKPSSPSDHHGFSTGNDETIDPREKAVEYCFCCCFFDNGYRNSVSMIMHDISFTICFFRSGGVGWVGG